MRLVGHYMNTAPVDDVGVDYAQGSHSRPVRDRLPQHQIDGDVHDRAAAQEQGEHRQAMRTQVAEGQRHHGVHQGGAMEADRIDDDDEPGAKSPYSSRSVSTSIAARASRYSSRESAATITTLRKG